MKINMNKAGIYIILSIFIFAHLYLGMANVLDNKISHESPNGYMASDTFWHLLYSKSLKTEGDYTHFNSAMVMNKTDILASNPPFLPHSVVGLSYATGLELYDSQVLIIYLIPIFSSLLIFLIIRRYDLKLALLSIPFTLLLYYDKFLSLYTWGIWTFAMSNFILVSLFYILSDSKLKKEYWILGILMSGIIMSYAVSVVFAIIFIIITIIIDFKNIKEMFTKYSKAASITLFLCSYYIYIFYFTVVNKKFSGYAGPIASSADFGYPVMEVADLGILAAILLAGILIYFFFIKKKLRYDFIIGFFSLAMGYLYFIAFGRASLSLRYFWPIHLAVFFGIFLLFLIKLIKQNKNFPTFILSGVLIAIFTYLVFSPVNSTGIMSDLEWDSLDWINENLKDSDEILYAYSDSYTQTSKLMYGKNIPYMITMNEIESYLRSGTFPEKIRTKIVFEGVGDLAYKKSFFNFGSYREEFDEDHFHPVKEICDFNYIVFNMANYNKAVSEYNAAFAKNLIESKKGNIAFNNEQVFIIELKEESCYNGRNGE